MKSEWKKDTFIKYIDLIGGGTPKTSVAEYWNGSIPWLSVKDFNNDNRYVYTTEKHISEQGLLNSSTKLLQKDDIIISARGTVGELAMIPFPMAFNQSCYGVRAKDGLNKSFLYYLLKNKIKELKKITHGSVFDTITRETFSNIVVDIPDYQTQCAIASILGGLDDKIELNNKINDNLEQQARNVFIDWFVLFSPFANEEFVTSPIGTKIPATLKMVQIANIPHLLETGKRPKGGAASDGIPSVGAENVKQLGKFDFSSNKYIPVEFAKKQKTGKISGYELLLYKDGGRPGTFIPHFSMFGEGFPYKEFFINEHVFKLDFFDHGKNEFAYFYMQTDYAMSWLANNGGKAAIPGINKQNVQDIWIYDMEHPKVKQFCSWVQPFFKAILEIAMKM